MESMLLRVAKAIDGRGWSPECTANEACKEALRKWALALALNAIREMRTPTPAMLRAAAAAMSPGKRPTQKWVSNSRKHKIRYQAMIDAAAERPIISRSWLDTLKSPIFWRAFLDGMALRPLWDRRMKP